MGSENIKLPNIDFSHENLKPGTLVWNQVKSQVHKALVEYGCFEASFDKIPIHLRNSIFKSLQELFDLPLQTKLRNISKKPFHGYVGQYPAVPLYESMGIDDANIPDKVEKFIQILWPQGNPSFCKTIQSYSEKLSELDQTIRKMILESLGIEKYTDEHMSSTNYLLRVMKYKGPQSSETKLGLNSHTDKNIVTILYQNQVNGLEVLTKDGQWINVDPTPNTFIVMIGDSLYAWANGRLHSPYHRVMMKGNEARYSVGLFSIPKAGYMIKAPEELVDDEHPLLFKPFDHVEFLAFYYTEEGQRCASALNTYCGV
ncbi:putative 2-oxoglutarate-dependent dioxygenase AOP1 [Capsicum annuum]|uniref:2-oxoglutarate-dependent dioxygenase AOP1 n=1 Tax=Capsicum annuum TaxID=4072 RepID=A0A1U8H5B6_CAPAN|nr:probable 2-oxoglutarate-dependent dioxygenase AOP1 [Capsicum annuum]PHT79433.1 putative 2-oxoglutarate-dependent dioxygenase AOP1 [Capsicum annuum]